MCLYSFVLSDGLGLSSFQGLYSPTAKPYRDLGCPFACCKQTKIRVLVRVEIGFKTDIWSREWHFKQQYFSMITGANHQFFNCAQQFCYRGDVVGIQCDILLLSQ